jgi:hypothetical protein
LGTDAKRSHGREQAAGKHDEAADSDRHKNDP